MDFLLNKQYLELLKGRDDEVGEFFYIPSRSPFKYITNSGATAEFSSIAHNADSDDISIPNLEPAETEIYFIIPSFKNGMRYQFRLPSGKDSWGVSELTDQAYITWEDSPYCCPNPNWGFFIKYNYRFQVKALNRTGAAGTPEVRFQGIKYLAELIGKKDERYDKLVSGDIKSKRAELGAWVNA